MALDLQKISGSSQIIQYTAQLYLLNFMDQLHPFGAQFFDGETSWNLAFHFNGSDTFLMLSQAEIMYKALVFFPAF